MAAHTRRSCAGDVDALLAIENAVFPTDRLSRRSLRRLVDSDSADVLVAEAGGEVAGYCIVLFRANTRSARLYSIAVAPGRAGRGLGRSLLDAAERAALLRRSRTIRLEVRADNDRAIAIYLRAGFRPAGTIANYYRDGATALKLEKDLLPAASEKSRPGATADGRDSLFLLTEQRARRAAS